MQVNITPQEQRDLNYLTTGRGRSKWFLERVRISWGSLNRLRKEGMADSEVVDKARAFLQSKDARALLKAQRERENAA